MAANRRTVTTYIEDQVYENNNFTQSPLPRAGYEACRFVHCDFTGADLSEMDFTDCDFQDCNLSTVVLQKTVLHGARFKDCKMLGLHVEHCSEFLFEVNFDNCLLNFSSFYKRKMKRAKFISCILHEVDFTEADLGEVLFDNCDLLSAVFDQTILEKADLRSSFNYSIDPTKNRLKKARFRMPAAAGLLDVFQVDIG